MRVQENAQALEFKTTDVFGNPFSIEMLKGKKVLLSFLRFTGCPVCNLHVYSLLKRKEELVKENVTVVLVFESSVKTIKKYIQYENIPFTILSDPGLELYNLYSVEKSWGKFIKWAFSPMGMINAVKGYTKFHKYSSMDGTSERVEAEFLIDEKGVLKKVHYGNAVGDYMPMSSYLL